MGIHNQNCLFLYEVQLNLKSNLKTDPNIETKLDQSYVKDVDWVSIHSNRLCEADELADKQQRIATAKRKARHDVNVTDSTLTNSSVSPLLNGRRDTTPTSLTVH